MSLLKSLPFASLVFLLSCSKNEEKQAPAFFGKEPVERLLPADFPGEVSGIADSYRNQGWLWMLQDGGNPAELLTLSHEGISGNRIQLPGTTNRDWEDLVIGDGPDANSRYLYIADIGDNNRVRADYCIYRLKEPAIDDETANAVDKISFQYGDGVAHDADAILVGEGGNEIWVLTKESPSKLFRISDPVTGGAMQSAQQVAVLPVDGVTSAAQSKNSEILLRTYGKLYFWPGSAHENIAEILSRDVFDLPVRAEPQGEAVCFSNDGLGFFTLSENAGLPLQLKLYFYPRN